MSQDGRGDVIIEELYPDTPKYEAKSFVVTIRVSEPNKKFVSRKKSEKSAVASKPGSKLVQRRPNSNMKLEQLNKHEERSYIQDAEANEAILKNIVTKDELCRYLSPLKFLEIQTWRKEVPCGDTIDEAEVEHRRWRTPIEILLPTVGRDDDGNDFFYDAMNGSSKEGSADRRKSTSTNSKRRKFFDDVRKQNAEMLQRSSSDAAKVDTNNIKGTLRASTSTEQKQAPVQTESRLTAPRNNIRTAEGRLRTAYAPANPIPPYKDGRAHAKRFGQIYVNHPSTINVNDVFVTSSFSPGKPVLSKIRNTERGDNLKSRALIVESKLRPFTSGEAQRSALNENRDSSNKAQRIQSSSWPGGKAGNTAGTAATGIHDDIQVLPLMTNRPQTVGNDLVGSQRQIYQRHMKFRGPTKPHPRALRHWKNKRAGIETTFNAATRLYQTTVLPKRTQPLRTFERLRTNRAVFNTAETHNQTTSDVFDINTPTDEPGPRSSAKTTRSRLNPSDRVTKISYALNRPNEIKVRTLQGPKQRETMSRVTPIPPIEMSLSRIDNDPLGEALYAETTENGGIKYISANGVIELNSVSNRKSTAPWVAEAFTPAMEAHEDYYSRQQRQNKSVTFRLGAS